MSVDISKVFSVVHHGSEREKESLLPGSYVQPLPGLGYDVGEPTEFVPHRWLREKRVIDCYSASDGCGQCQLYRVYQIETLKIQHLKLKTK